MNDLSSYCAIGQKWWAYSKKNNKFDAYGYTKVGGDYRVDATEAMELLSKHLNEAIPTDVELTLLAQDSR